eukprot:6004249-Alexandrium_andersonii.AAC.1
MSASLVGSEMCIRDRPSPSGGLRKPFTPRQRKSISGAASHQEPHMAASTVHEEETVLLVGDKAARPLPSRCRATSKQQGHCKKVGCVEEQHQATNC